MITIPIWLFIILIALSTICVIYIAVQIIVYARTLKIERDYHNRK